MLARGVLCRLTADVPKTCTHDVSQLARLLQRNLFIRNAFAVPAASTLSRGYRTARIEHRRSYATATKATQPTKTVKRAVKKTVAEKKNPTDEPKEAKKPTTKKKSAAKKKSATKKKSAAKQPRKRLTPEEKEQQELNKLKEKALVLPSGMRLGKVNAFSVLVGENVKGQNGPAEERKAVFGSTKAKWQELTPAELEHYNHIANEMNAANQKAVDDWIKSHTPGEISAANRARIKLRKKRAALGKGRIGYQKLHDDRTRPNPNAYILFVKERYSSGDLKGIKAVDAAKLIGSEWQSLSASEKKKYQDESKAAQASL